MAGKTVSAHVDHETAQRLADLARSENRSASQIVAEAIALYVQIPAQILPSYRFVRSEGTPEDNVLMLREISRAIVLASYDLSTRQLGEDILATYGDREWTEEEIEAEAVRLTSSAPPVTRRRSEAAERKVADSPAVDRARRK